MLCFAEVVWHLMNAELIVRLISGTDKIYISRRLKKHV